jgi:hypothetical protein
MSHIAVANPKDREKLHGMDKELAKARMQVLEIESLGNPNTCRICGNVTDLSKEHSPSKKAGNVGKLLYAEIDPEQSKKQGWVVWKTKQIQGIVYQALCKRCNNNTGSWYNPAYLKFSNACSKLASRQHVGSLCTLNIKVHPQRVFKQALTSIIASCQPGLTAKYPFLRSFLVNRENKIFAEPIHLWLYLLANRGARISGIFSLVDLERKKSRLLAEFSFWPLGWILVFDKYPIFGAIEITQWGNIDYHESTELSIEVPCQWALGPYPLDFRNPKALMKE